MPLWLKILLSFLGFLLFVLLAGFIFLAFNGRALFSSQVSSLMNRKVTVESVSAVFPLGLELKKLDITGFFSADRVVANVDAAALFHGELVISSVVLDHPIILMQREADASLSLPPSGAAGVPTASTSVPAASAGPTQIRKVVVNNGEVHLKDQKTGRDWVVEEISADITALPLIPTADVRTGFQMSASLTKLNIPFMGHFLKAKGWVNVFTKDMDASVQAIDDDGREGLNVTLVSKANDVAVKGIVKLTGKQQKQASGKRAGVVENVVLGLLEASATEIEGDVDFHTSMDHFDIGAINFKGKIKTGLQSDGSSGSIVDTLKSLGAGILGGSSSSSDRK